jgi:hypothetical protein
MYFFLPGIGRNKSWPYIVSEYMSQIADSLRSANYVTPSQWHMRTKLQEGNKSCEYNAIDPSFRKIKVNVAFRAILRTSLTFFTC